MIRAAAGLAFIVAAFMVRPESTAVFAAIAGLILLAWVNHDVDWQSTWRVRRVDGIPATRNMRRVLTVLLTGVPGLSGYPLSRLSGVGSSGVYVCLDRLETAGWVVGEWQVRPDGQPRRRFYRLTTRGHALALDLLGLADPSEVAS